MAAIFAKPLFLDLLFCFIFATLVILITKQNFFATSYNSSMFSLHGTLEKLDEILDN